MENLQMSSVENPSLDFSWGIYFPAQENIRKIYLFILDLIK